MSGKKLLHQFAFIVLLFVGSAVIGIADDFEVYFIHQSCGDNWMNSGMRAEVNKAKTTKGHTFSMNDDWSGNGDQREWKDRFRWNDDWENYDIVMFKSCYPASNIESSNMLKQYKDTYEWLATNIFKKNPKILFIIVTMSFISRILQNRRAEEKYFDQRKVETAPGELPRHLVLSNRKISKELYVELLRAMKRHNLRGTVAILANTTDNYTRDTEKDCFFTME